MPLTLYRYILFDLLKVFFLTGFVLVTIISFGATIKPLTDEGLMGPLEAIRYMLLAMVPMLQFALPFAAGFASTIVLHRMTSDNEVHAAAVSGISYSRLLAPVIVLGAVLTLIMVALTQTVIPRFWANMERLIAADVVRILHHSIDSGVPFRMGNLQIHADRIFMVAPTPAQGTLSDHDALESQARLILFGVTAVELDREGRVETDVTAEQAVVDVYRPHQSADGGSSDALSMDTYLMIAMSEMVGGGATQWGGLGAGEMPRAIAIPNPLRDSMRARTRSQLLALRTDPERHGLVRDAKQELARAIIQEQLYKTIDERLQDRHELELIQRSPTRRRYMVRADAFEHGVFVTNEPTLQVRQYEGAVATRRITAETVRLTQTGNTAEGEPLFELELLNVEVVDLQAGGAANRRARLIDSGLVLADLSMEATSSIATRGDLPAAELVAMASLDAPSSMAAQRVLHRIDVLQDEITSRILARYSQALTAVLLLTLGATLAMWLRGVLPLVVYVWAFLPSILNLMMINGGDKMMRDGFFASGVSVMWGGNAILLLLFCFAFWRLSKN